MYVEKTLFTSITIKLNSQIKDKIIGFVLVLDFKKVFEAYGTFLCV